MAGRFAVVSGLFSTPTSLSDLAAGDFHVG